jgi:ribosome-binding factor A
VTARTKRIDALLREEISELVTREVQDPGIGFLTVTGVETAPDLGHARVWVSVIGSDAERTATLRALERAMPFVRRRLGERLRLKRIPELMVRPDPTVERGTRLMHIIQDLEEGKTPEPLPDELPTPSPRPAVIAGRKRPRPSSSGRLGSRSSAKSRRDSRHDR